MDTETKYSLWLRPFGEVGFELKQQIKELSKRYHSPSFSPHVTLLGGLQMPESKLIPLTETLAHSLEPFTVYLNKAGTGSSYFQSLYIKVKKSEAIMSAHHIAKELFDLNEEKEYFPHLSLMYGRQTENEKNKLLNIMGRSFNMQFDVHSVLLIKAGSEVEGWKKIHNAEFKKHHREDELE